MKRAAQILITFVLFAVATAGAQSLGDYARSVRKDKSTPTAASKHYDNDNLPKTEHLSIVGPPPTQTADSGESKPDEQVTENATKIDGSGQAGDSANASKDEAEERQKMLDEWKKRLEDQRRRSRPPRKELDLLNREYRLPLQRCMLTWKPVAQLGVVGQRRPRVQTANCRKRKGGCRCQAETR
jgi:hypothetical protein